MGNFACIKNNKEPLKDNPKRDKDNKNDIYEKNVLDNKHLQKKRKNIIVLRGLGNIGATCYMNSTLQCLSNTEELTKFFIDDFYYIKEDTTKKVSNEYYLLLMKLWSPKGKSYYEPKNFKKILSEENPLFSGIAANDSKDLLNFLLERLHNELNTKEQGNIKNENFLSINQIQLDEEKMKQIFFNDYIKNFRSIISDLFYFIIETKAQCFGCNQIKYNFQVSTFIEFHLEEVNKYLVNIGKINQLVNIDGSNPDIDIMDCFNYYQKIEIMSGENQMFCNICNNNFNAYYGTQLYILPQYLIINLNRGKNAIYQCKVIFPEELFLNNYVVDKSTNPNFELYAVICHIGPSSMSGHFVAYCKNRMDHKWYLYNDADVSLCESPDEYRNHMPYILFYKSKNKIKKFNL